VTADQPLEPLADAHPPYQSLHVLSVDRPAVRSQSCGLSQVTGREQLADPLKWTPILGPVD
jgi:hypothetical protein